MPIAGRIPYTEGFEMLQRELIREAASDQEAKYMGIYNRVYVNDMAAALPERYIREGSFITTVADYTTGTVTVGTGTTNIIGLATSWDSANSDDFNINVNGFDQTFRMTFDAGTSLTYQQSLGWTQSSGSGKTYRLFQDRYALPDNFDYMVKESADQPNVVYVYLNNSKIHLTPWSNEEFDRNFTANVNTLHAYTVKWASGAAYLHLQSNPDNIENVGFSYIRRIVALRELTTGTATLSGASGTSLVLTSNASMTASLDTARTLYVRNDADGTGSASVWSKISTIADASTATLNSAQSFAMTSGASLNYTISEISEWPARFDDVILYKSAWIVDPDSVQAAKWATLVNDAIGSELTVESKRKRNRTLMNFPGTRQDGQPGTRWVGSRTRWLR